MNQGALEVEVKFIVSDLDDLRRRLRRTGAELSNDRTHEYNLRLDNARADLADRNELLRLRRDDAVRLTYKSAPHVDPSSEAMIRREVETAVADFEAMEAILRQVGFRAVQVYEKFRQTFVLDDVSIMLDEMPFGDFVELEGSEQNLRRVAARLGLDWQQRILDNYLALMRQLKARHDLPFDDLTFDNFAAVSARAADLFD